MHPVDDASQRDPGLDLVARAASALLLVPVLLTPAYEVANWPNVNTPTLVGVLEVAALLALVAGLGRVRPALYRPVVLLGAILLVWGPAVQIFLLRLPQSGPPLLRIPFPACAACGDVLEAMTTLPSGLFVTAAVLLVAAALPLAVMRRAPGRDAAGHRVPVTLAVRWLAVLCVLGGPPAGLFAWLSFANGDIYGTPFGIGVLVGLFGLVLLTGHAAAWALLGRARPAAAAAIAVAALVVLLPMSPGLPAGLLSEGGRPATAATGSIQLANGWTVSATSATKAGVSRLGS